jgi:flagellar hook-associated protein 3 FlgL
MRITTAMLRDQSLREIQGNLGRLAELQSQIASGKKFTRVDQDPLGASTVIRAQRGTRAIDQYTKNSTGAQVRLGTEEAVVTHVDDLLRQARDFSLSFAKGDPPYTAAQSTQRQVAADQLTRLLDETISLGNTRIGNEYILAGDKSSTPAFDLTPGATYGNYQGGTRQRQIEVSDGVKVSPNHTGDQFIGPAIAALKALRDAVDPANNQTEAQVQTAVQAVFDRSQDLLVSTAQTGTVGNQIVSTLKSNASIRDDMANLRGSVEDVPLEEATAKLLSLQTTIQASYSATGRLINLSLSDYLR